VDSLTDPTSQELEHVAPERRTEKSEMQFVMPQRLAVNHGFGCLHQATCCISHYPGESALICEWGITVFVFHFPHTVTRQATGNAWIRVHCFQGVWELTRITFLIPLIRRWTHIHPIMSPSALRCPFRSQSDEQSGGSAVRPPGEDVSQVSENVNRPPKCGVWLDK
jgi:hypothetical protein